MKISRRDFLKILGAAGAAAAVPALPALPAPAAVVDPIESMIGPALVESAERLAMRFRVLSMQIQATADSLLTMQVVMESLEPDELGHRCEVTMETYPDMPAAMALRPGDLVDVEMGFNKPRGPWPGSGIEVTARGEQADLGPVRQVSVAYEAPVMRLHDGFRVL